MSTPPFLTLPALCFNSLTMTLRRVVGRTISPFTLEEQSFKWPGEQWSADISLPPMTRRDAAQWYAFLASCEGSYGYFLLGDPSGKNPQGVGTGTPLADGLNDIGNTLNTKGWTPNIVGILKAGDYVQVGTGQQARLHMQVEDVDSDGSGEAILSLQPALRYAVTDNTPLTVVNAKGVFRLSDNSIAWSVIPGPTYNLSFSATEVVNA